MKHNLLAHLKIFLLLVLLGMGAEAMAVDYPAEYRVTTNLNIRKGPGTGYAKAGTLKANERITIYSVVQGSSMDWGEVNYRGEKGYVSMRYVSYVAPVNAPPQEPQSVDVERSTSEWLSSAWDDVLEVGRVVFLIAGAIILLLFWKQILEGIIFLGICMGVGSLITYWLFDNSDWGGTAGFLVGILLGIRYLINIYSIETVGILRIIYNVLSFPFYLLNKVEFFIIAPWRYIFKHNWMNDSVKEVVRPLLFLVQITLYVVSTPLRALNAFNYNILTHVSIELYDLLYEVLVPCSPGEGKGHLGKWLLFLPWRIVKYPLFHGVLVLLESAIWTVIDIFIPALTLYHGTDLTAGEAITYSPDRNSHLKRKASWKDGAFRSSQGGWGGNGVYFASMRSVAKRYATDPYRLSDNNPVMIVCRVSLGTIINYAMAPDYVYRNTGEHGNSYVLNRYAEANGYTTGEWWNPEGKYWELCLLDWDGPYDQPWRIRPLYIYNFRTGIFQHVKGGMRHWLFFDKLFKHFFE